MMTKQLYIIDDDKVRQETKYKPFVDMANIDVAQIRLIHQTEETSVKEIIASAACVCIHESMTNGTDKFGHGFDFGKLKQEVIKDELPRVFFSNSANQLTLLELPLRLSMRSDDFYMNLPPFIQAFQERSTIDLEILALGQNYMREKIIRLKRDMLTCFGSYGRDESLSMGLEERLDFKVLLEQFSTITQNQTFTDTTFRLLNSGKLTRRVFEQTLTSITKFIR